MREAVAARAPLPTKSDAESDVLDIILAADLERPDVNSPLIVERRRVVPDLRWPAQRLILEVDSTAWHTDPLARADDRERQALLEAHGETVLRVHWLDAVMAPSKLVARLVANGAPLAVAPDRPRSAATSACADPTNDAMPSSRSISAT